MKKYISLRRQIFSISLNYFYIPLSILIFLVSLFILFYFHLLDKREHIKMLDRAQEEIVKKSRELTVYFVNFVDYEGPILYMEGKYKNYIEKEILSTLEDLQYNLFVSIYPNNTIKDIVFYDFQKKIILPIPEKLKNFFLNKNIKNLNSREQELFGFFQIENQYFYFVATGIFWFGDNYKNNYGTFLFGKIVDNATLKEILTENLISEFEIIPYSNQKIKNLEISYKNFFFNNGYLLIQDYQFNPLFYLKIELLKKRLVSGFYLSIIIFIILLAGGSLLYTITLKKIQEKILLRLINFRKHIHKLFKEEKLEEYKSSIANHQDELVEITDSFNSLVQKINFLTESLQQEKEKTYNLLLNILPKTIVEKLKDQESYYIVEYHPNCSILFCDIVNFTKFTKTQTAENLVKILNEFFSELDLICENFYVEKIKTMGDCYMAATGLHDTDIEHADHIILFALEILKKLSSINKKFNIELQTRIGIHSEDLIAGIIGKKKFIYDIWGDSVNLASKLESSSLPNSIQISEKTYSMITNPNLKALFKFRGLIKYKKLEPIKTYISNSESDGKLLEIFNKKNL